MVAKNSQIMAKSLTIENYLQVKSSKGCMDQSSKRLAQS